MAYQPPHEEEVDQPPNVPLGNPNDNNPINPNSIPQVQIMRTLQDYLQPAPSSLPSCFIPPRHGPHYNIKPGTIQLLPLFYGAISKNPYLHIKEFEEVVGTF